MKTTIDPKKYVSIVYCVAGLAVNAALEMAGILHDDGREMVNGIIVRDENGLATGELREGDAMDAVMGLVPLPDERLAYSSVLTMMRILEQKGYVAHEKEGRAFVYRPLIDRC